MDVLRSPQREMQQASAHGGVGQRIDEDEAPELPAVAVRLEHHRAAQLEAAHADIVQLQLLRRDVLQRVDVDLVFDRGHASPTPWCAPIFIRYVRPWSSGCSSIQTMVASN